MPEAQHQSDQDYEVIKPTVNLKDKAKPLIGKEAQRDLIAAADSAVQQLSARFSIWMDDEIETMQKGWETAKDLQFSAEPTDAFKRSVHDIKGQASTFGYPLAGQVAASLSRIFETIPAPTDWPNQLVDRHVQAIRAMVAEQDKQNYETTARELCETLSEITGEYIASLKTQNAS